ncbi:hypothetical protein AMR41_10860, partial [Hapalosiphon sp. MRB220]
MNKLLLFFALIFAGIPASAFALDGYLGSDGYFSVRGLEPNKSYAVDLGGMPLIRAGTSNSCGILRIATSGNVKQSDRIEIKDEASGQTYGFENSSNVPVKEISCTAGQVKPEREIWKDSKGTIWISGLTPSRAQTIRLLTSNATRKIKANSCGFISVKLGNPQPTAIILGNDAFPLSGATQGAGIACRKGILYVSYPPQQIINAIAASTWLTQNSIQFSSATQVASISGGSTSWSPPPSNPNPPPSPGNACTVGVDCDPPPPPP